MAYADESPPAARMTSNDKEVRTKLEGWLSGLKTERYSWWVHWADLARYLLPRRYRWLVTPNQMNRGSQINTTIIDSTGVMASRVLSAGMMSGMTSPTRPWFHLKIEGFEEDEANPVNLWLAECRRRMMRVFQESNFYNSIAVVYQDLAVFGTAPMLIYEDYENVIHCSNPCAGEYYLGLDDRLMVSVFFREITLTVMQAVQWFGKANVSEQVRRAYESKDGAGYTREIVVIHAICPNQGGYGIPRLFKFAEFYWERGSSEKDKWLRKKGFHELPGVFPRWDVSGNDAYGRSPGMDALGDVKQLQQEQKRKAQVIDKMANPPMKADVELKNQPSSTLPGGVTYLTKKEGVGFEPVYQNFRPPIQELMVDIQDVQKRIRDIFFNDLFLMFQQMEAEPRSATAIDARREEKLVMLGPVLERFQSEGLDKVIDRVFGIMSRARLFPPAPPEIANQPIQVEYVSMMAAAQKATETAGIERLFAMVGNLAAVRPDVLDIPNFDISIEKYSSLLGNDPAIINPPEAVAQIREQRQQQEQAQQMAANVEGMGAMGADAAGAAKTLSETDVGGGINALQAMMGGGAGGMVP